MALLFFIIVIVCLVVMARAERPRDAYMRGYEDARNNRPAVYDLPKAPIGPDADVWQRANAADTSTVQVSTSYAEQIPVYPEQSPPTITPPVYVSPEEKEQAALRNMNVVLYVASFLFVAAAAALIASSVPAVARLIGLIAVVALFYGGGLVLYAVSKRVRPAAVAFVGTGLAILPFVGIALTVLGNVSELTAWLLVSAIGLVAYVVAAIVLQSQVISYVSLAFLISLASSAVASMQLPLVWYFIVLIGVSTLAYVVAFLRPTWLPNVFRKPLSSTGELLTPILLVVSVLLLPDALDMRTYQIIFGLSAAQYLTQWLLRRRYRDETVARILLSVAAFLIVIDSADASGMAVFGIIWLLLWLAQVVVSYLRLLTASKSQLIESIWFGVSMFGFVVGLLFWIGSDIASELVCLSLLSIVVTSGVTARSLRDIRWTVIGWLAALILLTVAARSVVHPAVSWAGVSLAFLVVAYGALFLRVSRRQPIRYELWTYRIAFALYLVASLLIAVPLGGVEAFWLLLGSVAALIILSYVEEIAWAEIIAAALLFMAVLFGVYATSLVIDWKLWVSIMTTTAVIVAAVIVHHRRGEVLRRNLLFAIAMSVAAFLVLMVLNPVDIVRQVTVLLLLAFALMGYGMRKAVRKSNSTFLPTAAITAYFGYALAAVIVALSISAGWIALALAVLTVLLWLGSYTERQPSLMLLGNMTLLAAVGFLWSVLADDYEWVVEGVAWISAAVFYGLYWMAVEQKDEQRQHIQFVSTLGVLALPSLMFLFATDTTHALAACGTVAVVAVLIGVEGYRTKQTSLIEVAIYIATIGAQRAAEILLPEVDAVVYAHWWAITIALTAWGMRLPGLVRYQLAVGCITVVVGMLALAEGGWYSLLFLIEHLGLLLVGALSGYRWAMWWGVVASGLAIMYFLRDYVYVWLGLLGLVLTAIVIWRLVTSDTKPRS